MRKYSSHIIKTLNNEIIPENTKRNKAQKYNLSGLLKWPTKPYTMVSEFTRIRKRVIYNCSISDRRTLLIFSSDQTIISYWRDIERENVRCGYSCEFMGCGSGENLAVYFLRHWNRYLNRRLRSWCCLVNPNSSSPNWFANHCIYELYDLSGLGEFILPEVV